MVCATFLNSDLKTEVVYIMLGGRCIYVSFYKLGLWHHQPNKHSWQITWHCCGLQQFWLWGWFQIQFFIYSLFNLSEFAQESAGQIVLLWAFSFFSIDLHCKRTFSSSFSQFPKNWNKDMLRNDVSFFMDLLLFVVKPSRSVWSSTPLQPQAAVKENNWEEKQETIWSAEVLIIHLLQ